MSPQARIRLDQLLVARGLARSRAEAQALVLAGAVRLGDEGNARVLKPGQLVDEATSVSLAEGPRWASRGGEKLSPALDAFGVDPSGLVCMDAGASTGGFTDVLLERGAVRVYAVDVGRGQLVDRLRRDRRVVVMDRTNLRTLDALPEPVALATLDLSFISLGLVLPAVHRLLAHGGRAVALVKPQFEAGRDAVPRGGVVRDPAVIAASSWPSPIPPALPASRRTASSARPSPAAKATRSSSRSSCATRRRPRGRGGSGWMR